MLHADFETAQETAERLGMTVRAIQKRAANGKIPGAVKHGKMWMIPKGIKLADTEETVAEGAAIRDEPSDAPAAPRFAASHVAMPLLNSAYPVGKALEYIQAMPDADDRQIALAEYYFFAGKSEESARIAEPYTDSHDPALHFSANLLCTFANLARGHTHLTRFAMSNLREQMYASLQPDVPPQMQALGVFIATTASVLLHLPINQIPPLEQYLRYLPEGLKLYACYVLAHKAYLEKDYVKCLTTAEMGVALSPQAYPIATIYAHIVAAMALANMKRTDEAKQHIDEAWQIAEPDGLIQPFGEHHGLLQGLIEVYFKQKDPAMLERIIAITYAFSAGWRKIHNPETGHDVADNLTTTEFTIAMLYSRGWLAKEIAEHLQVSERTVSNRIADIFTKLGVSSRTELGKFMLT